MGEKKWQRLTLYWLYRVLVCFGRMHPRRMMRNGRAADQNFLPDEQLFLRCRQEDVDEDGVIKPSSVHFPDQSTNREKYSSQFDVLLPDGSPNSERWIYWGVIVCTVADIPPAEKSAGKVSYAFGVVHDPLDHNYGHAELSVTKNGVRERNKNRINDQVKKTYRLILAKKLSLKLVPLI